MSPGLMLEKRKMAYSGLHPTSPVKSSTTEMIPSTVPCTRNW